MEICDGQSDTGIGFPRVVRVFPVGISPAVIHIHSSTTASFGNAENI
jgi:hypothetical protein